LRISGSCANRVQAVFRQEEWYSPLFLREHSASPSRHMCALIRLVFGVLVICALSQDTLPQATERANRTISDQAIRSAHAFRVERSPKFDGKLDDPIWQQAFPITDFRQKEPYEGRPATESTEVRVLYTYKEIYFGIVCHDSGDGGYYNGTLNEARIRSTYRLKFGPIFR
jgi:hypothetical protein